MAFINIDTVEYFENFWPIRERAEIDVISYTRTASHEIQQGLNQEIILFSINQECCGQDFKDKLIEIITWFKSKPKLHQDLRNDLFFGLGFILWEQINWKYSRIEFKKMLPKLNNTNPDYVFYRKLKDALRHLKIENMQWKKEIKKEIERLKFVFYEKSLLKVAEKQKRIEIEFYGQEISPNKNPKRKISKNSDKMATYLMYELAKSNICQIHKRYKEKENEDSNRKRASILLQDLAYIFGITLTKNLRIKKLAPK